MSKKSIQRNRKMPGSKEVEATMNFRQLLRRISPEQTPGNRPGTRHHLLNGMKGILAGALVLVVAGIYFLSRELYTSPQDPAPATFGETGITVEKIGDILPPVFKPPFGQMDVPFGEYRVDATEGAEITHSTGTVLHVPPHAFLNTEGRNVKGRVILKYREFHDALSVYTCGIPMEYDTLNKRENLVSAGMMEIRAYTPSGEPLRANPKNPIEIEMVSDQRSTDFNLYKLNEESGLWEYRGKDQVAVFENTRPLPTEEDKEESAYMPRNNGNTPGETVSVEPQTVDSTKNIGIRNMLNYRPVLKLFRPEEHVREKAFDFLITDIVWRQPEMAALDSLVWHYERSVQGAESGFGFFEDLLSNPFKGGNYIYRYWDHIAMSYNMAMPTDYLTLHFLKKNAVNNDLNNNRDAEEKAGALSIRLYPSFEGRYAGKTCGDLYRAYKDAQLQAKNKGMARSLERIRRKGKSYEVDFLVRRTFSIDGFGLWNCDKILGSQGIEHIAATYRDIKGDTLSVKHAHVLYLNPRGVVKVAPHDLQISRAYAAIVLVGLEDGRLGAISMGKPSGKKSMYSETFTPQWLGTPEEVMDQLRQAGVIKTDFGAFARGVAAAEVL